MNVTDNVLQLEQRVISFMWSIEYDWQDIDVDMAKLLREKGIDMSDVESVTIKTDTSYDKQLETNVFEVHVVVKLKLMPVG